MPALYYDSSALVKRYVVEPGSGWVRQRTDRASGNIGFTVVLSGPEMIAAVIRRMRGGHLSQRDSQRAVGGIRQDLRSLFFVVSVNPQIVERAMDIAQIHGLRGYDAVHVATALEVQRSQNRSGLSHLTFISADQEQLAVAAAEGLQTEDPNQFR